MPDNDEKQYDLEPSDDAHHALRSEIEGQTDCDTDADDVPMSQRDVHELDVCPNCGATMRGEDELVCMRCGFDLKSSKVLRTEEGEDSVDDDETSDEPVPLSKSGRGELWLPGAIAGISIVILIIAYAGGVSGFFAGGEEPNFGHRLVAILQFLVRLVVWGGCGLGALWITARIINQQPMGEWRTAGVRMLASVAVIQLVRFIGFESDAWETGLELVLQAGLFPLMLLAFFGMQLRDAAATAVITISTLLAMVLAPLIVSWSM